MKKQRKRLQLTIETVRDLTAVHGGIPTDDDWPDPPPPSSPTCHCAPNPTATCASCTLVTFSRSQ